MPFDTCPNCLYVHDTSSAACPICSADALGEGAEIEFDAATRSAIQHLGGIYGGILEAPSGGHVLWCARGVCLVEDSIGLAWRTKTTAQVDDVSVGQDMLTLSVRGYSLELGLADGNEREGPR